MNRSLGSMMVYRYLTKPTSYDPGRHRSKDTNYTDKQDEMMAGKEGMTKYRIEVQTRHHAETTSTPSSTPPNNLTYPTGTVQQADQTNHVDPPIKAEQPKLVNDSNQHQAERHVA
jgi:hypothetical protein